MFVVVDMLFGIYEEGFEIVYCNVVCFIKEM